MNFSHFFTDETELLNYAIKLKGKKVREIIKNVPEHLLKNISNKNFMGSLIENGYFRINQNNLKEPDFRDLGIELKVIPLKKSRNNFLLPKERMVISMINYLEDYKTSFYESHLFKKIKKLLIVQYENNSIDKLENKFLNVFIWYFPKNDLEVIKNDYEIIMKKIKSGKAHQISESDTIYLGACTKGQGKNKDLRAQPYSSVLAKPRAYSIKQSYLKYMNKIYFNKNEISK